MPSNLLVKQPVESYPNPGESILLQGREDTKESD